MQSSRIPNSGSLKAVVVLVYFLISLITKLHSNISSVSKPNKSLKNALVDKLYFFLHKLK